MCFVIVLKHLKSKYWHVKDIDINFFFGDMKIERIMEMDETATIGTTTKFKKKKQTHFSQNSRRFENK